MAGLLDEHRSCGASDGEASDSGGVEDVSLTPAWRPWHLGRRCVPLMIALIGTFAVPMFRMRLQSGIFLGSRVGHLGVTELTELAEPDLYQSQSEGFGTWYDPSKWGGGTCGYDYEWEPPGVVGTVALNFKDFNHGGKMRSCGMCIKVWAKGDYAWNGHSGGGSLPMGWNGEVFFVTNACATCPGRGDIDFALKPGQGANPGQFGNGKWDITWQGVPCPTEEGRGAHYMLDSGSNQYWVKARPLNLHYPVVSMEFQEGGKWQPGTLGDQFGFSWNPSGGPAPSPLKVRFTTAAGQVLEDTLPKLGKWVNGSGGISDKSLR